MCAVDHDNSNHTSTRSAGDHYRPEIDGLRAVAVVLVLMFHADLLFPGGYVGVDVFFVISGYLITNWIRRRQEEHRFSLAEFWMRRVQRLMPAATVMVGVTLAAGSILLLPADFASLSRSAIAQQCMLANVRFWRSSGYFDAASNLRPLLHTWSLAVEEQFYLFFPLLLICLRRWPRRAVLAVLIVLAVVSLGICEMQLQTNTSAAYYLLPARGWEMLLGGCVALVPTLTKQRLRRREWMSGAAVATIVFTAVLFDQTTGFPGLTALLPCAGAAVFIRTNEAGLTGAGRLLAAHPVVNIGLRSYSLYLWHWPLLAFCHYWYGPVLPLNAKVLALVCTVVLSWGSYRYVEQPFRRSGDLWLRSPLKTAVAATGFVVLLCAAIAVTDGALFRFSNQVRDCVTVEGMPGELSRDAEAISRGDLPCLGVSESTDRPVDFLVWGDSHALLTGPLFDRLARQFGLHGRLAAKGGHLPVLDVSMPRRPERQLERWNAAVFKFIQKHRVPHVILISRWAVKIEGRADGRMDTLITDRYSQTISPAESRRVLLRNLRRTIARLRALGVRVWVMEQVPLQDRHPRRELYKSFLLATAVPAGISRQQHEHRQRNVSAVLREISGDEVTVLSPSRFCFGSADRSRIADANGCFYRDRDHLSDHGVQVLLHRLFVPVMRQVGTRLADRAALQDGPAQPNPVRRRPRGPAGAVSGTSGTSSAKTAGAPAKVSKVALKSGSESAEPTAASLNAD